MNIQCVKYSLFNKWGWENWTATGKRITLDYFHTPYRKMNTKWIKYLIVRPETIKFLEENIGMCSLTLVLIFFGYVSSGKGNKGKTNKWDYIKLKIVCKARKLSTKQKGSLLNGRRYLQMIYLMRG